MSSSVKKGIKTAIAVMAIVIGVLELIGGIVGFISGALVLVEASGLSAEMEVTLTQETIDILQETIDTLFANAIGTIIGSLVDVALGVLLCIFGGKTLSKKQGGEQDGQEKLSKGRDIALIVLFGCMILLGIIGFALSSYSVFMIISFCLAVIGLILQIVIMYVPTETETANQPQAVPIRSTDEKIAELKRLKELGVINDEQYQTAIKKIIQDVAE